MPARLTRAPATVDERTILEAFARERLSPHRWSSAAGDTYAPHSHDYHKVLFCARGSITFHISETRDDVALRAGDRLDIEPGTEHSAVVGPEGVECIEAAL